MRERTADENFEKSCDEYYKKPQHINLQAKTIDGAKKKVCTKCIKTMNKVKK